MEQNEYLSFPNALASLALKFIDQQQPTQEEFCMWIFVGKKLGGLNAFLDKEGMQFPSSGWMPDSSLAKWVVG
jgi:hypothetical protein